MVELTAEQRDIKMAAQEFAEKEFRDIARELDEKEEFDDRIWKKAAENGFLAVFVPEEYGGQGLGHFEQCLILEEFARVDLRHRSPDRFNLFWRPVYIAQRYRGAEGKVPPACL